MQNDMLCGEPLCPRVAAVTALDEYRLDIVFTNGERRVFDASPLLTVPAFRPLQSKAFFQAVKVAYGTVSWANNIDYCPDTLYLESLPA